VRSPEVSLQLGLDGGKLTERGGDLAEDPGGGDVGYGESKRSVASDGATQLNVEEDKIKSRLGNVGAGDLDVSRGLKI
jgi:hypothetical protein